MEENKFFFTALVIGLLLSLTFYVYFGFNNISDFVVAKSITHYPNAQSWRIEGQVAFFDSPREARIDFDTRDLTSSVSSYYKDELINSGWRLVQYSDDSRISQSLIFSRRIGDVNYTATFILGGNETISFDNSENVINSITIMHE